MTDIRWFDNASAASAIELAKAESKPLLVDFWSPTCSGCAKLFAVTYRDPRVRKLLADCFVCIKYNTKAPNEWFKRLKGSFGHHWHPNIAVMDDRLTEARRFIGYLPPEDFIAQIEVGRALVALYRQQATNALQILVDVTQRYPNTHVAAEALYWAGVAAYRTGGGLPALTEYWVQIARRHPTSEWAVRADCLDVRIPSAGFSMSDPSSVELIAPQPA